ncbi:hypothetical protein [Pedobacter sp. Leaf194]|uniref:hypothetical protein n=1 Tax=Pedobacter sp. Leaf194 TaxID=1736297 RepID=UPI000703C1DD|nr:hypothetical protein [Pedobacter sp. Leaf194]KQS36083.1 hypothetical protein ASG14_11655 [Pedobacter sp. Leaf194]
MKQLFFIAPPAIVASGCAWLGKRQVTQADPTMGMGEDEFKPKEQRAERIYLSGDSATYKTNVANNTLYWADNVYHFYKGKLSCFEQKTHFFNTNTVKIEEAKK